MTTTELIEISQSLPIETIQDALLRMHNVATHRSDRTYMSIPADNRRDADLILDNAIRELEFLRNVTGTAIHVEPIEVLA